MKTKNVNDDARARATQRWGERVEAVAYELWLGSVHIFQTAKTEPKK